MSAPQTLDDLLALMRDDDPRSLEAVPVASAYRLKLHNGIPDEEFGTIGEAREAARVRLGWAAVYTGGWDTCGTEAGGYHESAVLYPAIDKAIADADYGGPVIVAIAAEQ